MKCQRCGKNEANVHSVVIINGVKEEKYLCSECAHKEQGFGGEFYEMNDFFSDFFTPVSALTANLSCENCGLTYDEFTRTGMLGCPSCYDSFRSRIGETIKKVQGGNTKNKPEKEETAKVREVSELEKLKNQLKDAINAENYEQAAVLRDKIKAAEAKNEEK